MTQRILMVLLAVLVAATILALTLTLGGKPLSEEEDAPHKIDLRDLPGARGLGDPIQAGQKSQRPFEEVEQWAYTLVEEDRTIFLNGDRLTPKPQGVSEVTNPQVRIVFSPSKMMLLTAKQATFVAPSNHPREGQFREDVVLTYFETPDGAKVDPKNQEHIRFRVYLDETRFDIELGEIDSAGPVHVTGRDMDFQGTGLSLTYNERRERIEHMEIFRGRSLRFRSEGRTQPAAAPSPAADAGEGPAAQAPAKSEANAAEPKTPRQRKQKHAEAQESPEPKQFYRARFEENVQVNVSSGKALASCDYLEIVFNLTGADEAASEKAAAGPASARPTLAGPAGPAANPLAGAAQATISGALGQTPEPAPASPTRRRLGVSMPPPASPHPTLCPPLASDVVVRWDGRLVLEPESDAPADMTEAEDVQLRFVGTPVRMSTDKGDTVTGSEVTYLASRERVTAAGNDAFPLQIASKSMGELRGSTLLIDPPSATGVVTGPGLLKTRRRTGESRAMDTLNVTWNDRLDLTFYQDAAAGPDAAGAALTGLKDARFTGKVVASHPAFSLSGQTLSLGFTAPTAAQDQQPTHVDATGKVELFGKGEQRNQQLAIRGEHVRIDLASQPAIATPDGPARRRTQIWPAALTADGNVQVTEQRLRLVAQTLRVTFLAPDDALTQAQAERNRPWLGSWQEVAPEPAAPEGPAGAPLLLAARPTTPIAGSPDTPEIRIDAIKAGREVQVDLADQELRLLADRLEADAIGDTMHLYGAGDTPAQMVHDTGTLTGQHLIVTRVDESVRADGPGRFTYQMDPDRPDSEMRLTWRRSMRYAHQQGLATFAGQVVGETFSATDETRLACDALDLTFAQAEPSEAAPALGASPADGDQGAASRYLSNALAQGNVVFTASSFTGGDTRDLLTRMRMEGQTLTFDNTPAPAGKDPVQLVRMPTPGKLLVEDRRSAPARSADSNEAVAFAGRGATLFVWAGAFTLDVLRNDMLIEKDVWMLHQPEDEAEPKVQLECQRLLADVTETGGLGAWANSTGPKAQIRKITADQAVRVERDDQQIFADHLSFDEAAREVVLTADEDRHVRLRAKGDLADRTAGKITWHLDRDRLDATWVGGGTAPVPR